MKVDVDIDVPLRRVGGATRAADAAGFDGVCSVENKHDPFLPLLLAAEHSERLELRTAIAVAFARSPMILAGVSHDLNAFAEGRFTLGLGSQIKPHILKRFSMPWGAPAAQMRELILAMRAIWANWHEGKPLEFVGKYYTHTLMTPMFTPENPEYGAPRVALAAVGPMMTEVAGEVADGVILHPFSTQAFIETVTMPAIERGLAKSGRKRDDFEISYSNFVVTGRDEAEFEASKAAAKERIAFYGSTPAYKGVLDSIGIGDLQGELNALSKQGRWVEMGGLITDDILDAFAVVGPAERIAPEILRRYGSCIDHTTLSFPIPDAEQLASIIRELRAG